MKTHPARMATLLAVAVLGFTACPSDDPVGPGTPTVNTDWNQDMSEEELREIAEALGVNLVEEGTSSKISKDDIVAALEEATGCGCFGAVCGTGKCGHQCGTCTDGSCFSGTCEDQATCPTTDVTASSQKAQLFNDTESLKFRYDAELPAGSAFDKVRITYNAAVDDALPPGTYDLRERGLNDCKPCVTAYKDCLPDGGACATAFVAQAGQVQIDEITPDGQFRGSLTDLKFETAYEDPKTGLYTILTQFGANCVPTFAFDVNLESIIQEPQDCDPEGNGTMIGNKLADFTLQNCNGEDVNLHSACGKKALWLIAAAGW